MCIVMRSQCRMETETKPVVNINNKYCCSVNRNLRYLYDNLRVFTRGGWAKKSKRKAESINGLCEQTKRVTSGKTEYLGFPKV